MDTILGYKNIYNCDRFVFPTCTLRSVDQSLLLKGKSCTQTYGDRACVSCAPLLWNTPPVHIRSCDTIDSFKSDIKTYLFREYFKDDYVLNE